MKRKRANIRISDNAITWLVAAFAGCVSMLFYFEGLPQKWHAAILWTCVAFGPPTLVRRKKWRLWKFWTVWGVCFGLHIAAMWAIFGQFLASVHTFGTLYILPFASVEAFALLIVFSTDKRCHWRPAPRRQHEKKAGQA